MKEKEDEDSPSKKRKCENENFLSGMSGVATAAATGLSNHAHAHAHAQKHTQNWRDGMSPKSTLDVLTDNFRRIDLLQTCAESMEGDIPQLSVKDVFVGSVRIGWPYPTIMTPQRQMASQLIQAFKNQRHVVLESPTGTGKSASILCTAIAWQRHDAKLTGTRTKIIYCSRTHSQVTQAVASLKETPYRPRMAIVGSRGRLCIHEDSKEAFQRQQGKGDESQNVFLCQIQNKDSSILPGEVAGHGNKPTCPHYEQLESKHLAMNAHTAFVPDYEKIKRVSACQGEKSNFGLHDIEDLVEFGKQPNLKRNCGLYSSKDGNCSDSEFADGISSANVGDSLVDIDELMNEKVSSASLEGSKAASPWDSSIDNDEENPLASDAQSNDDPTIIHEAACPYYLSRVLAKDAHLLFAPYNYVIDPAIRDSIGLDIADTVVVLDEAHNIESILRENGSGEFSEIGLAKIIGALLAWSGWTPVRDKDKKIPTAAHELSFFLEKIAIYLRSNRNKFENAGFRRGIDTSPYFGTSTRFHHEVSYDGPPCVQNGVPIGCANFFHKINLAKFDFLDVEHYCSAFISFQEDRGQLQQEFQELQKLVQLLSLALNHPEHFFISSVLRKRGKKKNDPFPEMECPVCTFCKNGSDNYDGLVVSHHADICDGSIPKWDSAIVIRLLSAGVFSNELFQDTRSVVLASGSMSPILPLCKEINLLPPTNETAGADKHIMNGRLQIKPPPLEANHIIKLEKQLFAASIGHFPDGSPLFVKRKNYNNRPEFYEKLGDAVASIVEGVRDGGILVFFPSFDFLGKCINAWQKNDTWERLIAAKGEVILEPTSSSQSEFNQAKGSYNSAIGSTGNCILFAVFRGKMSEGISFNDNYARAVICVGIPYPNIGQRLISAKMAYNDEQRKYRGSDILSGREWYNQEAFRAVSQAIGRCIRHSLDYGAIVLLDGRYNDDRGQSANMNLPKWMRYSVRTLRKDMVGTSRNDILGGFNGLAREMDDFFYNAKEYTNSRKEEQREIRTDTMSTNEGATTYFFDSEKGLWSPQKKNVTNSIVHDDVLQASCVFDGEGGETNCANEITPQCNGDD